MRLRAHGLALEAILDVDGDQAVGQLFHHFARVISGVEGPEGVQLKLDIGALLQFKVRQLTGLIGPEFAGVIVEGQHDALLFQHGLHGVDQVNQLVHLFGGADIIVGDNQRIAAQGVMVGDGLAQHVRRKISRLGVCARYT